MGILEIRNLKAFVGKKEILKNINISFERGKFYGIIGPNGTGKSTLFSAITGIIKDIEGDIFIKGDNIKYYSIDDLSREISLMSQEFQIKFPYTIEEIVAMGRFPFCGRNLKSKDIDIVNRSLEDTELIKIKKKKITELSGGETQRVFFAKTICKNTDIILIDEGFSNADIYYKIKFLKLIKEKAKKENKTIIFIMHDLQMARKYCDELVILNKGSVYDFGKSSEVLNKTALKDVFNIKGEFIKDSLEVY